MVPTGYNKTEGECIDGAMEMVEEKVPTGWRQNESANMLHVNQ